MMGRTSDTSTTDPAPQPTGGRWRPPMSTSRTSIDSRWHGGLGATCRRGSRYIARLLTEAGIECDHERVFSPAGYRPCFGVRGESSWFAAPYSSEYEGIVLHQVREPLATVASLASRQMWGFGIIGRRIEVTDDPLLNAVRFGLRAVGLRRSARGPRHRGAPSAVGAVWLRGELSEVRRAALQLAWAVVPGTVASSSACW